MKISVKRLSLVSLGSKLSLSRLVRPGSQEKQERKVGSKMDIGLIIKDVVKSKLHKGELDLVALVMEALAEHHAEKKAAEEAAGGVIG